MRIGCRQRRLGVTLVEIVTVMAIIMILASLSFFAFSSAKSFADRVEGETRSALLQVNRSEGRKNATGLRIAPAVAPPLTPVSTQRPARVPGQYFVGLRASAGNISAESRRLAALVGGRVLGVYPRVVHGFGLACDDAKAPLLASDPAVLVVEQANAIYPCQATFNVQRVQSNGIVGQTTAALPTAVYGAPTSVYRRQFTPRRQQNPLAARASPSFRTRNVPILTSIVAVMDTGIDYQHPDLVVLGALDFTGGTNPLDTDGHGTHVAGVIAAVDSTAAGGVVGVYPGAQLISLKVMDGMSAAATPNDRLNPAVAPGSNLSVYGALTWLLENSSRVDVCVMPFQTTSGTLDTRMNDLVNAVANTGILMVAAAGNDGKDLRLAANAVSPATARGAIAVGSLLDTDGLPGSLGAGADDTFAAYSNYGANVVVFATPGGAAAPGYSIGSTVPVANFPTLYSFSINNAGAARAARGTSFSAAHVAGLLATIRDPQVTMGFILGHSGGASSFRPLMTGRASAISGLTNLTHHSSPFQMINPITGNAWYDINIGGAHYVFPYTKSLYNDIVTDPNGNVVPVPNLYVNPNQDPSFLPPFPG